MSIAGSDLRLLKTCGDPAEAATLRSLLEAQGIACVVQGEQHRSMLGMMGSYIDVNVLVAERDLPDALALLQETEAEAPEGERERQGATPPPDVEEALCPVHGERSTTTCSRCGTFLCARCDGQGEPRVCEDCYERSAAHNETRRGAHRRWAAWVVLAILFGPVLFMALLTLVYRLLG
jgi:hypothetical protein